MKILQIVGAEFKKGNGITIITHELIQELNLHGIKTELLLLTPTDISVNYIIHQNIHDYDLFFANNKFDLVVFHGLFYYKYYIIAKYLALNNIPYIIKPHSSLMRASHKKSWLKKKVSFIFFFNKFIKNSSSIIFSNDEERRNSVFFPNKYFIETNGITLITEKNTSISSSDNINLLFLSRIDFQHKGIDYLIKGFKEFDSKTKLSNVKLNIYGTGINKELVRLNKLIKDTPSIKFFGPIFGEAKDKLLKKSDILLLTSRYEGFPTILIDVLCKGIPVIITPGTNATFFEKEGVGWIADLLPNSIAMTLERAVLDYTNRKQEIKKRCIIFVHENFDIKKTINETISIYYEVINSSSMFH